MRHLPEIVLELARVVEAAGGRAMLNGGCVRDPLPTPERETKDWDIEVYHVEPERLRSLLDEFASAHPELGALNVVGEAFAVYKIGQHLDISLPRRERKSGSGHRGFVVEGDPEMSFKDACRR